MFKYAPLDTHPDITVMTTAGSLPGMPLMETHFLRVDDLFIDSGNPRCDRRALGRYLGQSGPLDGCTVVHTHLHEDHCGNTDLLVRLGAGPVWASGWRRHDFSEVRGIYRLYWGRPRLFPHQAGPPPELTTGNGTRVVPLPTPGHTACHTSFFLPDRGLIIAGDAVPMQRRKLFSMPDEDYVGCIGAMRTLLALLEPGTTLFTSHRGLLDDPRAHLQERIHNMEEMVEEVREDHRKNGGPPAAVARRVLGRPRLLERLMMPRFSLEQTARSILSVSR